MKDLILVGDDLILDLGAITKATLTLEEGEYPKVLIWQKGIDEVTEIFGSYSLSVWKRIAEKCDAAISSE